MYIHLCVYVYMHIYVHVHIGTHTHVYSSHPTVNNYSILSLLLGVQKLCHLLGQISVSLSLNFLTKWG